MAKIKGFDISGLKEVYNKLKLTREEIEKGALKGLNICAQNILGESRKLVPIDTGTLMRSGQVSLDKEKQMAVISYNTPYARKQHEDMTLDHSSSRALHGQGEAKYLERPFNEKSGELEIFIVDELEKILRKK